MKDINRIILVGRLGADATERKTKKGLPVVRFSVATSRKTQKADENGQLSSGEETQWHNVICWGKHGEKIVSYLRKGREVYIEGSVRTHHYETKTGETRLAYEVHSETIRLLGKPPELEKTA